MEDIAKAISAMQETLSTVVADVNNLKKNAPPRRSQSSRAESGSRSSSSSPSRSRSRSRNKGARRSRRSRQTRRRHHSLSRSRSPYPKRRHERDSSGSRSTTPVRSKPKAKRLSWGERMDLDEKERPDYSEPIIFSDSEDEESGEQRVVEVSEEANVFLTKRCTHSLTTEVRRKTRKRFPLPKVPATKTLS